jgi:hypothetical protein
MLNIRFGTVQFQIPQGKILQLFDANHFEISAPQHPTHYPPPPAGCADVLDIVVRQNIQTLSDILDSDHLPIVRVFHIMDLVTTNKLLEPLEKFTGWERFQSLASDLISPRLDINSGIEADKAPREYTASIASAHRLSTSTVKRYELNHDHPGLDR